MIHCTHPSTSDGDCMSHGSSGLEGLYFQNAIWPLFVPPANIPTKIKSSKKKTLIVIIILPYQHFICCKCILKEEKIQNGGPF